MTKATAEQQQKLLQLQQLDNRLTQITHRRANLPVDKELTEVSAEATEVNSAHVIAQTAVSDLERAGRKAEIDVDQVADRIARNEKLLESGALGPKESQGISGELDSLRIRHSELEDAQLELMEQLDGAREALVSADAAATEVQAKLDGLNERRDQELAELADQEQEVVNERAALAAELPADLLNIYERLRKSLGGVAVAKLERGVSGGSGFVLSPAEVSAVKALPADAIAYCEESGVILVRGADAWA